jgi:hypothetical protein
MLHNISFSFFLDHSTVSSFHLPISFTHNLHLSFTLTGWYSFSFSIRVYLLNRSIFIVSFFGSIRIYDIFLSIRKLHSPISIPLYLLNCSIREYAFFLSIREQAFYCSIRETDLFSSINKMLFYLAVWELKHLETICKSRLSGFCFWKVVTDLSIWESLLHVVVVKLNYWVTIRPNFSLYTIGKDNFFSTTFIYSLDFTIMSNDFFNKFELLCLRTMILTQIF